MAERDDIEKSNGEPAAGPDGTPNATPKTTDAAPVDSRPELPAVESPSISPAAPEPVAEPRPDTAIPFDRNSPIAPAPTARAGVIFGARNKHNVLLAASVAIAAALGVVVGTVASGGLAKPKPEPVDLAATQERKAMQQSIAQLSKEIATLKASVEAANKSAHTQITKIGERLVRERAEITGSISAPQTVAPAPLPPPRPSQQSAAIEGRATARVPVVPGWSLRMARDGRALVEGHGDIYEATPGVPVPGLGMIREIKREDGRWMAVTPRGIVVSMRDRRYFEPF